MLSFAWVTNVQISDCSCKFCLCLYGIFFRIVNIAVVISLCTIFFVWFYFVIGKLIDCLVNSKLNNVALELEQQTGEPIEPITIYPLSMEWFIWASYYISSVYYSEMKVELHLFFYYFGIQKTSFTLNL